MNKRLLNYFVADPSELSLLANCWKLVVKLKLLKR